MENSSNVQKTVKRLPIVVSRVFVGDFQKQGTLTAELKQTVTIKSSYPGKQISNNKQDNIFDINDFGFETKDYETTRVDVAWLDVPVGSTVESVQTLLDSKFPTAVIYRTMSNKPILHSGQMARLEAEGDKAEALFNQIANRQVLRYSDRDEENAGKLILDTYGKPQYKATYFSRETKEDEDLRNNDPQDFYASPEILAELGKTVGYIQNQTV